MPLTMPLISTATAAAPVPLAALAQREKLSPEELAFVEKTWPDAKKTNTGIRYVILQPGSGEMPKPGDKVAVLARNSHGFAALRFKRWTGWVGAKSSGPHSLATQALSACL